MMDLENIRRVNQLAEERELREQMAYLEKVRQRISISGGLSDE